MTAKPRHDDMPAEIDFSKGELGKLFRKGAHLRLPVYLDDPLRKDLELIEVAR